MFLKAIADIGFSDSAKLKKDIEQLYKNPTIEKFLDELSVHIHPDNVVTLDQQHAYEDLENIHQTLSSSDLLEACRHEEFQKKLLLEEQQSLQSKLISSKKRFALLQQQLNTLNKVNEEAVIFQNNLQDLSQHTATTVKKSHETRKTAFEQYLQEVSNVRCDCELISSCYKTDSKDTLLSHVDLGGVFLSEDSYTIQLTEYAKKQFRDVSVAAGDLTDLSFKLYSAADTIVLGDGDRNVKSELLNDLKRATLGYASRKKRSILAKANLEKSIAINNFLKQDKVAAKYLSCRPSESGQSALKKIKNHYFRSPNHVEFLKNSIENINDQCSYILKSHLPNLLSKGEPELKNLFLTGDFKRKLNEQREIRSKQSKIIELLLQQCSRLSVVWMLLKLERIQSDVLAKHMFAIQVLLDSDLKTISADTQIFNAAAPVEHSTKDPKAVIDKRDQVMINLHDLLVGDLSSTSMFKTFETIQNAAGKLEESNFSISHYQSVNRHLRQSVESLHTHYYDGNLDDGSILLGDPQIASQLEKLQNVVAEAKISVSKLLSDVDKKRAFIGHNEAAARERQIWIDFVLKALEKK